MFIWSIPTEELRNNPPSCPPGFQLMPAGRFVTEICAKREQREGAPEGSDDGTVRCSRRYRDLKFFGNTMICIKRGGVAARHRRCASHPVNCAKGACQPSGHDCPINSLVWKTDDESYSFPPRAELEETEGRNYFNQSVEIEDNLIMHYGNQFDKYPIVDMQVVARRGVGTVPRFSEEVYKRGDALEAILAQFGPAREGETYINIPEWLILYVTHEVGWNCKSRDTEITREEAVKKAESVNLIILLTVFVLLVSMCSCCQLSCVIPCILTISGKFCVVWCPGRMEQKYRQYMHHFYQLNHQGPEVLAQIKAYKDHVQNIRQANVFRRDNPIPIPPCPPHLIMEDRVMVMQYKAAQLRRYIRNFVALIGTIISTIVDVTKFGLAIGVLVISYQVRNFFASISADCPVDDQSQRSVDNVRDHVESKSSITSLIVTSLSVLGVGLALIGLAKDILTTFLDIRKDIKLKKKISNLAKDGLELTELK